jgi:hypothetical protein
MSEEATPYVREPSLHRETEAARTLRKNMADIFSDDEDLAADMVEGETRLHEAIGYAVETLAADCASIIGLDDLIKKLKSRQDRIGRRIENTRTALSVALTQAGKKSFEHPVATLTLKAVAPSVTVTDEAEIPARFFKPQPPKLDKAALKKALKDKEAVPGAVFGNGGQALQVKFT